MIDRLLADHERVSMIARRLESFLDSDAPPTQPDFAQLRWTLFRELTQHHAVEQGALLCNARAGEQPYAYDRGLSAAFNNHMAEWTGTAIHTRWSDYCSAARALLVQLRLQIQHEEDVLFPRLRC